MKDNKNKEVHLWDVLKRAIAILLPFLVLVGVSAIWLYQKETEINRVAMESEERYTVGLQKETVVGQLKSIITDLTLLRLENELHMSAKSGYDDVKKTLREELLLFSENFMVYDQVRLLDETGMEIIRVNLRGGGPYLVPEEDLQSKAGRYYFKETIKLGRAEVYVSAFDLNVEHGEIEVPLKPTIRFGTQVFSRDGRKRGIVVLNYLGEELINSLKLKPAKATGQSMLINSDGYWLYGPNPEYDWAFMYEDKKGKRFGDFYPEAWQQIAGTESGQLYTAAGMFTFETVYPRQEVLKPGAALDKGSIRQGDAKGFSWKIVSYVPLEVLSAKPRELFATVLSAFALLFALVAVLSWFPARAVVRRKVAEEELQKHHERLEELVTERTAELKKAHEEREMRGEERSLEVVKTNVELQLEIAERRRADEELEESREQLRSLAVHLQTVRESERIRIARDVHDELGQILSVFKLDLLWINKRLREDQKPLIGKIKEVSELVDGAIDSVQRICSELRPTLLDDVGIVAGIEWQAGEFQKRTGIECRVSFEPEGISLDEHISVDIFRIFQETLTNVARHAGATRIDASLKVDNDKLLLEIQDNGRGIKEGEISGSKSFGLMGMRERVYSWGGELYITGIAGKGTTILVSVPLDKKGGC